MASRAAAKLSFIKGDLFTAPPKSILVHACNTRGSWGGGIALAFKQKFPKAYKEYRQHCEKHGDDLLGSCFVAAPDSEDQRAVACLFTSRRPGAFRDDAESILAATETAVKDLQKQNKEGWPLHACKFNSGIFAVPWEDTQKVLEKLDIEMTVYDL